MNLDSYDLDRYVAALRSDADRVGKCAERADLTTAVTGCPGWSARDTIVHLGGVHRWATHAIEGRGKPAVVKIPTPDADASGAELGEWMRVGADVLADVLEATPLDEDTWHPFPLEQKAWVWSRRQAIETMLHRWDIEFATTRSSDLDQGLAADGLHEFFEMLLPRRFIGGASAAPAASLHVHCTNDLPDGLGEWIIWGEDGEYRMEAVHRKGDAAVRGNADTLLLAVMGRTDGGDLDLIGDHDAVTAWLDLPGP